MRATAARIADTARSSGWASPLRFSFALPRHHDPFDAVNLPSECYRVARPRIGPPPRRRFSSVEDFAPPMMMMPEAAAENTSPSSLTTLSHRYQDRRHRRAILVAGARETAAFLLVGPSPVATRHLGLEPSFANGAGGRAAAYWSTRSPTRHSASGRRSPPASRGAFVQDAHHAVPIQHRRSALSASASCRPDRRRTPASAMPSTLQNSRIERIRVSSLQRVPSSPEHRSPP